MDDVFNAIKSTCTKLVDVFDENEDSVKIKVQDEDIKTSMERRYLCRKQQFKVTIGACNHNKEKLQTYRFVDSNDLLGIPRATLVCSGGSWSVKFCYHQHRNHTHISFGRGYGAPLQVKKQLGSRSSSWCF